MAKRDRENAELEQPIDELCVETNELLNLQYYDLSYIITRINQHDAPNSPKTAEYSTSLAANYDPEQFDIYIKNTNEVEKKEKETSTMATTDCQKDFVKYGRGWVKKNSSAYLDMRKRNNEAIHKCRSKKAAKTTTSNNRIDNQTEIVQELVKEIVFLKNFLDVLDINEDKYELEAKIQQLNNLLNNE